MRKEYTFHSKEEKLGLVKRELLKKEAEVVRLKKSIELEGGISEKVIQQTYALVQQQAEQHSIVELCKLYKVSRWGYYKWPGRNGQLNCYEKAQKQLDGYVKDIHAQYPSMGYRQVRDFLQCTVGQRACDLSVWGSMRRLHIHGSIRKSQYPSRPGNEHAIHPRLSSKNQIKISFRSDSSPKVTCQK